jgi:hypothetical protein
MISLMIPNHFSDSSEEITIVEWTQMENMIRSLSKNPIPKSDVQAMRKALECTYSRNFGKHQYFPPEYVRGALCSNKFCPQNLSEMRKILAIMGRICILEMGIEKIAHKRNFSFR